MLSSSARRSVAAARPAARLFAQPNRSMAMVTVYVDDVATEVDSSMTILQACEVAGSHVPRFCYHERLSIAGNCRMCLVEVQKSPKARRPPPPLLPPACARVRRLPGRARRAACAAVCWFGVPLFRTSPPHWPPAERLSVARSLWHRAPCR